MPLVYDPEKATSDRLAASLPQDGQSVQSIDAMNAWLNRHPETYVVIIGPHVSNDAAIELAAFIALHRPGVSSILVRPVVDTEILRRAMQAGSRDVVAENDPRALSAAVVRAHQLSTAVRTTVRAEQKGKIISVFSPKGGVGKTTTTVNLALALSQQGARRVVIADLDLGFGDVAITMQMFPTHSIEHAVGGEYTLDFAMLEPLLTAGEGSIQILAAPSLPDAKEQISTALVSRVLRTLKDNFDYVVVDTAPAFDEQTLTALEETDECIVIATLDVPTLKNVKVAIDTLDALDFAPGSRHLVLNRADDAVGITPQRVEAILGMPIATEIGTSVDVAAATNSGRPIFLSDPTHQSSQAFKRLAGHVSGETIYGVGASPGFRAQNDRSRGLFRKRR